MNVTLLPRLVMAQSERLLAQLAERTKGYDTIQDAQQSAVRYAASGGRLVDRQTLAELHGDISKIAKACGFPDRSDQASRGRFDSRAAQYFATHPALGSGEALRDDFWAYLATVLLWRVALWRFPAKDNQVPRHHMLGGVRNVFQRLWLRGRALDRGPEAGEQRWELLDALSEDGLVQITERPSIAGYPRLARLIAEGWVRSAKRLGRGKMEDVMRRAVIGVRLRNEVLVLALLTDDALTELINREFERAALSLGLD